MVVMQYLPDSLWLQAGLGVGALLVLQWARLRAMEGDAEGATETLGEQLQTVTRGTVTAGRAAVVALVGIGLTISSEGATLIDALGAELGGAAVAASNVFAIVFAVLAADFGVTQSQYLGIAFGVMGAAILIRESYDD